MSSDAARVRLAEAIAWWRLGGHRDRRALSDSAADALAAGIAGSALDELAGVPDDENPTVVDDLIARIVDDLGLGPEGSWDLDALAARRIARRVLSGELGERELSGWAHRRFHHRSDSEVLNLLALLDDEYDDAEDAGPGGYSASDLVEITRRIREAARRLVVDP